MRNTLLGGTPALGGADRSHGQSDATCRQPCNLRVKRDTPSASNSAKTQPVATGRLSREPTGNLTAVDAVAPSRLLRMTHGDNARWWVFLSHRARWSMDTSAALGGSGAPPPPSSSCGAMQAPPRVATPNPPAAPPWPADPRRPRGGTTRPLFGPAEQLAVLFIQTAFPLTVDLANSLLVVRLEGMLSIIWLIDEVTRQYHHCHIFFASVGPRPTSTSSATTTLGCSTLHTAAHRNSGSRGRSSRGSATTEAMVPSSDCATVANPPAVDAVAQHRGSSKRPTKTLRRSSDGRHVGNVPAPADPTRFMGEAGASYPPQGLTLHGRRASSPLAARSRPSLLSISPSLRSQLALIRPAQVPLRRTSLRYHANFLAHTQ